MLYFEEDPGNGDNNGGVMLKSVRPTQYTYYSFAWEDGEEFTYTPGANGVEHGEIVRVSASFSNSSVSVQPGYSSVGILSAYEKGYPNGFTLPVYKKGSTADFENAVVTVTMEAGSKPSGTINGGSPCSGEFPSVELYPIHGSGVITLKNNNGACEFSAVHYADGFGEQAGGSVSVDLTPVLDGITECSVLLSGILFVALLKWLSSSWSAWRRQSSR